LNKLVAVGENKLKNQKFVESAPEKVVAGARKQLAETTEKRDETQRILEGL
jgi:valyl-tRNA synthetase